MKRHITKHNCDVKHDENNKALWQTYCGIYVSPHNTPSDSTDEEKICKNCLAKSKLIKKLNIEIFPEEITVTTINDKIEVVHWTEDEWIEDPTIVPAIVNAIHLAHTDPDKLIHINWKHMDSQYRHRAGFKD